MKTYKDFEKKHIGSSEYATLVMVGYREGAGIVSETLRFGEDGSYKAYICEGNDVKIGEHYTEAARFNYWLKMYDDCEMVQKFEGKNIVIYRAAEMGCIIHIYDDTSDDKSV